MKEKEKARKTNANRTSGGGALVQPSPKGDSRVSLKVGGIGLNVNESSSRRTLREGKTEKLVKTPANSNKLIDNSTVAGISHMNDVTAKSHKKASNSNSPMDNLDKLSESSTSGVLIAP